MNFEEVKEFLKVDFPDDDNYINLLIEVAIEYINDAIGVFNPSKAKHRLLALTIIDTMYKERSYVVDSKNSSIQYILRSIVLQEQFGSDEDA
ncbi:head-tail connector protein [Clostridium perfringens]|uniref:head-tail connector protein n=1 Tax=Clostridium perfringens TaxID=1502 RepID=UPI0028E1195D|nr:head-tail connector protein [Clostridium perfringens]MDT9337848.1 head-tail connector protein [Clostridium perfringens]MDT9345605.1 head-tail connector protein [Clostridium perfringens]MDT9346985.1 head-tail connector protein [Clostridium perfringens]MDT9354691.1 head-tail connector protein [Clostridium perfringens]